MVREGRREGREGSGGEKKDRKGRGERGLKDWEERRVVWLQGSGSGLRKVFFFFFFGRGNFYL
jgi:hypothetical protein